MKTELKEEEIEKNICKYCGKLYVFPLGESKTCKRCEKEQKEKEK